MFKRTQHLSNASLMPGFHPSVAVLPLPFCRCPFAVPLYRCRSSVPYSYRCRCCENGIDGNGNGATEFFYVCNVILTVLTEFLRNFRNGNGETATAERQRKGGNQALHGTCTKLALRSIRCKFLVKVSDTSFLSVCQPHKRDILYCTMQQSRNCLASLAVVKLSPHSCPVSTSRQWMKQSAGCTSNVPIPATTL